MANTPRPPFTRRHLVMGSLAALATPTPVAAGGTWRLRRLEAPSPLTHLVMWGPRTLRGNTLDLVLALHGTQPGTSDPTWFSWLRAQSQFQRRILVVPALKDPHNWSAPDTLEILRSQLDFLHTSPVLSPARTFLIGFSSGASEGFRVASRLASHLAGFAAIAGRLPALSTDELNDLRQMRLLLACMERDSGVRCEGVEADATQLSGHGLRVERHVFEDLEHECPLDRVAPVLDAWMG